MKSLFFQGWEWTKNEKASGFSFCRAGAFRIMLFWGMQSPRRPGLRGLYASWTLNLFCLALVRHGCGGFGNRFGIAQVIFLDRIQVGIQFIDQRNAGGNVQFGNFGI